MAVEAMRAGADDYIMKDRLVRLGPAVKRELQHALERQHKREADEARVGLEEQLRQSQKMEAVGQLASGIAHDFNNLLTVITSYCSVLLKEIESDNAWHSDMSEIKNACDRAASLTQKLLAFSRKQILQPTMIDLGQIVIEMESVLTRVIDDHINFDVQLDPTLKKIMADTGQIEQVVMNLVVNARDAISQAGSIVLSVRNVALDDQASVKLGGLPSGDYVMLSVSDSGMGMDKETRSHIFEPFYTTKGVEKGTGLGLSTIFGIVKQSGGGIEVQSEPGRGSDFRIYFPCVDALELDA
jgi:two-component system cell cycle sensor histidine kinase/response regulator CckA